MADNNITKLADILKSPTMYKKQSASKKDGETAALGRIYNFLVKDREEKNKRQVDLQRIQKQSDIQQEFTPTSLPSDTPTATVTKSEDKGGMFGSLAILGIVAVGAGAFIFSKEIQEKIDEIGHFFKEATWTDAFQSIEQLFDFSGLMDELGFGYVAESVQKGAEISKFDESQLNILSQGGALQLGEEEFKQIQSQHAELAGKSFTDAEANIAAQGFKARDIQTQLGTTDLAQTISAEKLGVESTKKLYAAPETASAVDLMPDIAKSNRNIFYDESGKARTVGQVRESFAQQATGKATGTVAQIMATIRDRESGGDYTKKNPNGSASGAYQFIDDTWQTLSKTVPGAEQYQHAKDAPPQIQDEVARKYIEDILKKSGGDISAVPRVWYSGNLQGKMSAAALAANKGYTVQQYVQHWMQDFQKHGGHAGTALAQSRPSGAFGYSPTAPQDVGVTSEDLTYIKTSSGLKALVHKAFAGNFQGFINDLEGTGYKIKTLLGYADRNNVNNPSVKSYHALGAAIDINPENNPNRSTKTDLPPITSQLAAKWGIGWGMNWSSVKDPMHFSIAKAEQGSVELSRNGIAPGEQLGVPTGSTITPVAMPSGSSIPTQERKQSSKGGNTIIMSQNQYNVVNKKVNRTTKHDGYKDRTPQDILQNGPTIV